LQSKGFELFQGFSIKNGVVVEGYAIETEIGALMPVLRAAFNAPTLNVIDSSGTEGERSLSRIFAATKDKNVRRIVDAGCRRHPALVEKSILNREDLVGTGGH